MIFTQKAAREKIQSLESRVTELESNLNAANEREQALQKEVLDAQAESAPLQAKVAELEEENEGLTKSVEELQKENEELTEKATATAEKIGIEASRQLAAQGHPAPVAVNQSGTDSKVETKYEQYRKLQSSDPVAASAFWDANEKDIIAGK